MRAGCWGRLLAGALLAAGCGTRGDAPEVTRARIVEVGAALDRALGGLCAGGPADARTLDLAADRAGFEIGRLEVVARSSGRPREAARAALDRFDGAFAAACGPAARPASAAAAARDVAPTEAARRMRGSVVAARTSRSTAPAGGEAPAPELERAYARVRVHGGYELGSSARPGTARWGLTR